MWLAAWRALLGDLDQQQALGREECFTDASFPPRKKRRRSRKDPTRKGHKGAGDGRRPRSSSGSVPGVGSPAEVTLVQQTLDTVSVPRLRGGAPRRKPKRLIANKGYGADGLRIELWLRGIERICPHRRGRKRPPLRMAGR